MWIGIRIPSCADRSRGKPQQQKRLDSRGLRVLWHATPHIGPDFRDPDSPAQHRRTFPKPKAPTPISAKRPTLAVQGTCAGVWRGSGGAPSQSRSTLRSGRSGNGAWPKGNPRGGRSARPSPERKNRKKSLRIIATRALCEESSSDSSIKGHSSGPSQPAEAPYLTDIPRCTAFTSASHWTSGRRRKKPLDRLPASRCSGPSI